jgi:hypothetical protein
MAPDRLLVQLSANPQPDGLGVLVTLRTSVTVQAWTLAALDLVNAEAVDLVELTPGRAWRFTLRPRRAGSYAVLVPAGAMQSASGMASRPSNRVLRYQDAPALTIDGPTPLLDGPADLIVRSSRPVDTISPEDLHLDGLVVTGMTALDASTWRIAVMPKAQPTEVAVAIPAGAVSDALGIGNAPTRWQSYAIPPAPLPVRPILEHVRTEEDGTFTAVWGYLNDNPARAVRISVGEHNRFVPGPQGQGQPELFLPGRHVAMFETPFSGGNLVWSLRSPNGTSKTATAGSGAAE